MSIIRVNKTKDFTVMSNRHLRDQRISLKAKGLMSQMLALPEDWDYSIAGLAAINKESDAAIKSALKELKAAGYLVITKKTPDQTESGRFEYIYDLYEEPQETQEKAEDEKQATEKQEVEILPLEIQPIEIQAVENHLQLNIDKSNTDKQNTEESNKEDEREDLPAILKPYSEALEDIPEVQNNKDLLIPTIAEFAQMRKKLKKPIPTSHALALLLKKTAEMADRDPHTMKAILDQSTMNGWSGIYELKEPKPQMNQNNGSRQNPFTALLEEMR